MQVSDSPDNNKPIKNKNTAVKECVFVQLVFNISIMD